jgi:hypothetical protein
VFVTHLTDGFVAKAHINTKTRQQIKYFAVSHQKIRHPDIRRKKNLGHFGSVGSGQRYYCFQLIQIFPKGMLFTQQEIPQTGEKITCEKIPISWYPIQIYRQMILYTP